MSQTGHSTSRSLGAIAVAGLLGAHGLGRRPGTADVRLVPPWRPRRLAVVDGLSGAEAVSYDSAHDAYYVSRRQRLGGRQGRQRLHQPDHRRRPSWIRCTSSRVAGNGVELNGPMGSRIRGDTLWVLDIDALRAFDTGTGAPLATSRPHAAPPAPAERPDLRPGRRHLHHRYRPARESGRHVRADRSGPDLLGHAGPARDRGARGLVAERARRDRLGSSRRAPAARTARRTHDAGVAARPPGADGSVAGPGEFDGLEVEADGRVLLTSWGDFSVLELRGSASSAGSARWALRRPTSPWTRAAAGLGSPSSLRTDSSSGRFPMTHLTHYSPRNALGSCATVAAIVARLAAACRPGHDPERSEGSVRLRFAQMTRARHQRRPAPLAASSGR